MTIYIGNVPFNCTELQLFDLFAPFGTVFDLNYPTDRVTGAQRGFAFASLDDQGARDAIKSLDGTSIGGRDLKVTQAKAPDRPDTGIPVGFRRMGENPFGGQGRGRR